MYSVTYIGARRTVQTVTSPSYVAARLVQMAMIHAGYRARMWHHGKGKALSLLH